MEYEATQETVHWVIKDNYPVARKSSFNEAVAIASKTFDDHPTSHVTVKKETRTVEVLRTFKPFPKVGRHKY